jgi:hypothetical protein
VDAPTFARSPATSSHPRPFGAPRPARPSPLAHLRPQPNRLALSLGLLARSESSATAHRRPSFVLRPASSPCPVCCLGELRLTVSYSGYPLVRSFSPMVGMVPSHRSFCCAAGAPPPSIRSSIAPLPSSKSPRVRTRGEQPAHALNSAVTAFLPM